MPGQPRVAFFPQLLGHLWDCFVCRSVGVFDFPVCAVMASDEGGTSGQVALGRLLHRVGCSGVPDLPWVSLAIFNPI